MAKVNALSAIPRVRVVPASDELRQVLVHPRGAGRFRASGSIEWPLDTFTKRRLHDGDVTIEERKKPEDHSNKEHGTHARRHDANTEHQRRPQPSPPPANADA